MEEKKETVKKILSGLIALSEKTIEKIKKEASKMPIHVRVENESFEEYVDALSKYAYKALMSSGVKKILRNGIEFEITSTIAELKFEGVEIKEIEWTQEFLIKTRNYMTRRRDEKHKAIGNI